VEHVKINSIKVGFNIDNFASEKRKQHR